MIEHDFIKDDADMPVLREPIYVADDDINSCQKAFAEESPYKLPVVFVSKIVENEAPLGFEITEAGKHYKNTFRGDQRYMVTVGKTPSDNRSGNNNVALINKMML